MSIIRPDLFDPPHIGNPNRVAPNRFYMSAEGLNQGEIPVFTPTVAQNYSDATMGATPEENWISSEIVASPSFSSDRSAKLSTSRAVGDPITSCGSVDFGRRIGMPIVTEGHSVWQRIRMYIPATFSWGYAYGQSDGAEAAECNSEGFIDGTSNSLKWLVFSPNSGAARIYLNLDPPRRQVAQKSNANIRVITETGGVSDLKSGFSVPTDQWVSFQLGCKVSKTGAGWIRAWVDDDLVCELTGINTISESADGLNEWGIGPYWNGIPWSDGEDGRGDFYVDDIIVTSTMDNNPPPYTEDSSGNLYIANSISVGDL